MSPFPPHTVESAPAASRPHLEGLAREVGFVPNLAAVMAGSPTLLRAFLSLRSLSGQGSLEPATLQLIEIASAVEQRCTYCVAAHSTFALKLGAPAETVEAVRQGRSPADPRLAALTGLARRLARREEIPRRELEDLDRAGVSPAAALEAVVAVALQTLAGYVHRLASAQVDTAFQPQVWESPAAVAAHA